MSPFFILFSRKSGHKVSNIEARFCPKLKTEQAINHKNPKSKEAERLANKKKASFFG